MIDGIQSGVYKITNVVNGKFYIGSTRNFIRRFREHKCRLKNKRSYSRLLQRSWDKYGEDSFLFDVILICDKKNLILYEQRSLDVLKPELNILKNAYTTLGRRHSEETKKKMSLSKLGVRMSDETKKRLSEVKKGFSHSQETIEKLKKISQERGKILSVLYKGRKASIETRKKMSESAKIAWDLRKANRD